MDQMMNIMNNTGGGMLNVMGGGGGGGGGAGPGWNSAGPGGMNGSAGGPPADDQMASAEEFYQFLQQYQAMGGEMDPDKAPPELAPFLRALQEAHVLDAMEAQAQQGAGMPGSQGGKPPEPGDREEIFPEPGFVVKTIDDAGRKIFINICGHAKIGAPGSGWANGKVPEQVENALANIEDPENIQHLRFPLSCSEGRNELDKSGQPCTVYDAIFNDDVVKQAIAYRRLKIFIVDLCMQWVGQKYSLNLDPKYKLPHRKYMGDKVQPQCIRVDKKALIEEVQAADEEPSFPLRPRPKESKSDTRVPQRGGGGTVAGAPPTSAKEKAESALAAAMGGGAGGAGASAAAAEQPRVTKATPTVSKQAAAAEAAIEKERESSSSTAQATAPTSGGASSFAFGKLPEIEYEVQYVGRPVEEVVVKVKVPQGTAFEKVQMAVVREAVTCDMPGRTPLRVQLPFALDAPKASATAKGSHVSLRVPYKAYDVVVEEARTAKLPSVGELKLSSNLLDI